MRSIRTTAKEVLVDKCVTGVAGARGCATKRAGADAPEERRLRSASLPGKLADCSERERVQVRDILRRGRQRRAVRRRPGRDRRFQAILPLRGKILNVEKARDDARAEQMQEIKAMITAFGGGHRARTLTTSRSCGTTALSA